MARPTIITQEEMDEIERLLKIGYGPKYIEEKTGWSRTTIRKIADDLGYGSLRGSFLNDKAHDASLKRWLIDNWHWERPSNKKPVVTKERTEIWRGSQQSNFITPYSYPRLWDQERRTNGNTV